MNNIIQNIMDFLGFDDGNTHGEDDNIEEEDIVATTQLKDKVVDLHKYNHSKVVVINLKEYDDVIKVCDNLRKNKVILINLENISHDDGRRVLDFISGACYALDGAMQKVDANIFVVCPNNVEITGDLEADE